MNNSSLVVSTKIVFVMQFLFSFVGVCVCFYVYTFTSHSYLQMEDFIKAIFADSPLRKECLWRIESANF